MHPLGKREPTYPTASYPRTRGALLRRGDIADRTSVEKELASDAAQLQRTQHHPMEFSNTSWSIIHQTLKQLRTGKHCKPSSTQFQSKLEAASVQGQAIQKPFKIASMPQKEDLTSC
ncbi:hypothetical protein AVEN_269612-1 [Araneus ventricosus]|uniref:Uncharacterized protein n=1 Tax=Araneus ventricosus TaxID=182803 RepID=A0A4Y2CDH3_ARAVE|nr:hypothetical protein AVEN_269612-1 [Araneus ventricosus]